MRNDKYLLAIPVWNEAPYLRGVIAEARRHIEDILVIDDGSTDETPEVLDATAGIHVIRHPSNLGYGRGLRDAFDFAIAEGYGWLITMDCDEQHEPSTIPDFIEAAETRKPDIVSGSRYLWPVGGEYSPPPARHVINRRITRRLNEQLGFCLTDAFCGFKAYRTDALKRLRITVPGYAMPLQLWVQAARAGLRVVEVPVRLIYKDMTRNFGGPLDDPVTRYAHYLEVLDTELAATDTTVPTGHARICHAC